MSAAGLPGLRREGNWPCTPPWQGRFSHLKCPSPNRLEIADSPQDLRRYRVQLEWVDPSECREGFVPCQFVVEYGETLAEAFGRLGKTLDLERKMGERFKGPQS